MCQWVCTVYQACSCVSRSKSVCASVGVYHVYNVLMDVYHDCRCISGCVMLVDVSVGG